MFETKSLVKAIGDKAILRGISLTVEQGKIIGILGPNGAGKSTFLKIIGGLVKPSAGEVLFNGLNLKDNEDKIKKKIGFLAHNSYLYDHLSPLENLLFFARLYQVNDAERKAKQLIEEVGLKFFLHEPVRTFSRGMIQRLAIARSIIHSPTVLLLDEPHTGLDQEAVKILNKIILKMKDQGAMIIMVTHDFNQAVAICDRLLLFNKGKVVDDFQVEDINIESVKEKYLTQVGAI